MQLWRSSLRLAGGGRAAAPVAATLCLFLFAGAQLKQHGLTPRLYFAACSPHITFSAGIVASRACELLLVSVRTRSIRQAARRSHLHVISRVEIAGAYLGDGMC
jgi:hypothetical protein